MTGRLPATRTSCRHSTAAGRRYSGNGHRRTLAPGRRGRRRWRNSGLGIIDGKHLADRILYRPGVERPLRKLEVHPGSIGRSSPTVACIALLDDEPNPTAPWDHQDGLGIHFPSGWKRAKKALEPGGGGL